MSMKKTLLLIITTIFLTFVTITVLEWVNCIPALQELYPTYNEPTPYDSINVFHGLVLSDMWINTIHLGLGATISLVGITFILIKKERTAFKLFVIASLIYVSGRFTHEMFLLAITKKSAEILHYFLTFNPAPYIISYDVFYGIATLTFIIVTILVFLKTKSTIKNSINLFMFFGAIFWLVSLIIQINGLNSLYEEIDLAKFYIRYIPVSLIIGYNLLELTSKFIFKHR